MNTTERYVVIAAVGLAILYLLRCMGRAWTRRHRGGCGGGCRCAKTHDQRLGNVPRTTPLTCREKPLG